MRRTNVLILWLVGFFACADTQDPSPGASSEAGTSDAKTASDGSSAEGSSSSDAAKVDSSTEDGGEEDADVEDANDVDANDDDAGSDTGVDAPVDSPTDSADDSPIGVDVDAGGCVGTIVNPGCVPPSGNFAACGTAAATSTYFGWPASRANDSDLQTSWFAETGACPANACSGSTIRVDVALNMPRTVGRLKLFGNREFAADPYDVLTGRLELLDGNGTVLYGADVSTGRGTEPNGDVDHVVVGGPKACVKTVRVIVKTAEGTGPGFSEIQALAN